MIKGPHHNADRCRDPDETRAFYQDFLGLPLASVLDIHTTQTGRAVRALHTFFRMGDGSFYIWAGFAKGPDYVRV